jgi:hypothetical protein
MRVSDCLMTPALGNEVHAHAGDRASAGIPDGSRQGTNVRACDLADGEEGHEREEACGSLHRVIARRRHPMDRRQPGQPRPIALRKHQR